MWFLNRNPPINRHTYGCDTYEKQKNKQKKKKFEKTPKKKNKKNKQANTHTIQQHTYKKDIATNQKGTVLSTLPQVDSDANEESEMEPFNDDISATFEETKKLAQQQTNAKNKKKMMGGGGDISSETNTPIAIPQKIGKYESTKQFKKSKHERFQTGGGGVGGGGDNTEDDDNNTEIETEIENETETEYEQSDAPPTIIQSNNNRQPDITANTNANIQSTKEKKEHTKQEPSLGTQQKMMEQTQEISKEMIEPKSMIINPSNDNNNIENNKNEKAKDIIVLENMSEAMDTESEIEYLTKSLRKNKGTTQEIDMLEGELQGLAGRIQLLSQETETPSKIKPSKHDRTLCINMYFSFQILSFFLFFFFVFFFETFF